MFSLNLLNWVIKNICHYSKVVWTCHLLCQRRYHNTRKTHVKDRTFNLTPINISVIYQITGIRWVHWNSIPFRENSIVRFDYPDYWKITVHEMTHFFGLSVEMFRVWRLGMIDWTMLWGYSEAQRYKSWQCKVFVGEWFMKPVIPCLLITYMHIMYFLFLRLTRKRLVYF